MQPEPTELPTLPSTSISHSDTSNTTQHGFVPDQLHSAEPAEPAEPSREDPGFSAGSRSTPRAVESRDVDDATLQEQLRELKLDDSSEHRPKPSVQRISEYENALLPRSPPRQSEGPEFKIIKKKGRRLGGPQFDQFPNEVLTHILSHLPPTSLSVMSQVCRRLYSLVTTPHAWRVAFSRYFPGHDAIAALPQGNRRDSDQEIRENLRSEQRFFTRLTALASWRSEYILRTRLLRSLSRGKPAQIAPGHGASSRSNSAANNANAVVTYSSQLFTTINHIHAVWSNGKKSPRFIHGADETGSSCTSDPNIGKIDHWGLSDPQALPQFADLFLGDQPFGEGQGPAGLPNSMDVSQPFGLIYGEGFPGGQAYFRSTDEMRGRFLSQPSDAADHQSGIPNVPALTEAVSAVWIAKSTSVPTMTDGLVGLMIGSTLGIVTSYTLGADTPQGRRITRIARGQATARWILSPGVPIIALSVDESYNLRRKSSGRIWAVALNALREVFYLTETPTSDLGKLDDNDAGRNAWKTGRTAHWQLVEPTRRLARDDPYHEAEIHGSYSPRSSSNAMSLSREQIIAETFEIEKFLRYRPAHFRKVCEGWDMRRSLEVDFAGDDGKGAGEGIFVIRCGFGDDEAEVTRFTRWRSEQVSLAEYPVPKTPPMASKTVTMASLFGGGTSISPARISSPEPRRSPLLPGSPRAQTALSTSFLEEWRSSELSLKGHPRIVITTNAIDMSTYALLTVDEDPLRTVDGNSNISSPFATPSDSGTPSDVHIPGHRARYLGLGTKSGMVIIFNMRGPQSTNSYLANQLEPLRTIHTDSPQISCLAVSALHVVHGGNDGLVQTWDPLASTLQPIRTLNSRFFSRARRRLVQAEASIQGVGINLYAAGAIAIDPDPTVLRGMVSLGTHLRYWSYSSSAADQYQSKKRRLRRPSERGSNGGPDRFTTTGRGALMDYIATEQEELKNEKWRRSKEQARLRGRFGVGLGGLSEEEALRYAEMISEETFQKDAERRSSDAAYFADVGDSSSAQSIMSSENATPEGSITGAPIASPKLKTEHELDYDIEEAIRISLLDGVDETGSPPKASGSGEYDVSIKYKAKKKGRRSASSSPSTSQASRDRVKMQVSGSRAKESLADDDLDYALQLSLAEERSRVDAGGKANREDFPSLSRPDVGKGKGRAV